MSLWKKVGFVVMGVALFLGFNEFLLLKRLDYVRVVVAKEDLGPRTQLNPESLVYKKMSRTMVPNYAFYSIDDALGQYIKMDMGILEGDILRKNHVETLNDSQDSAMLLLNETERIYSLKADIVKTAGASLQRGHYVDVAHQQKQQKGKGIILENIRVVGVKDRYGNEVTAGSTPHVVLLAVTQDVIYQLLDLEMEGNIVLLPKQHPNS